MKRRYFLGATAATVGSAVLGPAFAQSDAVLLEISGQVPTTRTFTMSQLQDIGTTRLITSTAWTDGTPEFEGVLGRSVLEAVGSVRASQVTALALNGYRADIPLSDFYEYDVLFAWSMDGKMLTRRDKGPLWIVYPRDAVPQLREERYEHRWVWQLNRLIIP
jgi:hypothetical protein